MMLRPKESAWDKDARAMLLTWPADRRALDGAYDCRMAVCWPGTLKPSHGDFYSGYLALLGVNRNTLATYLFGLHEFQTAGNVLGQGGTVRFRGIQEFVTDAWKMYAARTCYWAGDWEAHRKWLLEVSRDAMIIPKPSFVETLWSDPQQGILNALQWLNTGKIFLPDTELQAEAGTNGTTIRTRLQLAAQHLESPDPDVFALAVGINGLACSPPRRV